MNLLLIAFIIFAIIDLTFVGTTMFFVAMLVIKVLNDRNLLEEITKKLLETRKKDKRGGLKCTN